ncbi:MAG: hypothetical protein CVV20_02960, partial [Gemmatimonadetes bacterium HGW-Gemmatimonadetes-1]
GGVFTPALYIGAATGGAFGAGLNALFPEAGIEPAAYAIVGMGAMVASATAAPITGILMIFEMTDDYAIMLPLMVTVAIAVVVSRRMERDDLYSGWLRRRGIHLEHGMDRDALSGLTVVDAIDRAAIVVRDDEPVTLLLARFAYAEQTVYPVVDPARRLLGTFTLRDLGEVARAADIPLEGITALDVAHPTEAVTLEVPLADVVRRLGTLGVAALPVVDAPSGRVLGTVGRAGILHRVGMTADPTLP